MKQKQVLEKYCIDILKINPSILDGEIEKRIKNSFSFAFFNFRESVLNLKQAILGKKGKS